MDSRSTTPAIVGAAQVVQRPIEADAVVSGPIELMLDATRQAAADAGSNRLLDRVGWIGVAGGYWRYRNPGELIAEALGCSGAGTALSSISGSAPQELVGRAAALIATGQVEVALVLGGEARYTSQRLKRVGQEPPWETSGGTQTPELIGGFPDDDALNREFRMFGAAAPAYALMSDSMRAADGETVAEHRTRLAELWADFSQVAADNPFAWDRRRHTVDEIRDARPDNRMIAFPYTKAMVANNNVDMASAIVLCRVDTARGWVSPPIVWSFRTSSPRPTRRGGSASAMSCTDRRRLPLPVWRPCIMPVSGPTTSTTSTCTPASRRSCG